jgi:ribosomal protein S27AE
LAGDRSISFVPGIKDATLACRTAILLAMKIDPLVEWQRLSETYSRMYDAELLELAAAPEELTDQARQVLDIEVKRRGLQPEHEQRTTDRSSNYTYEQTAAVPSPLTDVSDAAKGKQSEEAPREYTWKTPLCGCDTQKEALLLSEALRRAGIENWIERPGGGSTIAWDERMVGNLRILVAADQLGQAREIADRPIPKDIVDESQTEVPEFDLPACPKCGAQDPVLEDVDPVNRWHCDACGNDWAETEPADATAPEEG